MPQEHTERKTPLGADLVIPALALAFAAYFFVSIDELSWEAKANGVIIGWLLVGLIAVQLVRMGIRLARGEASLRFDRLWLPRAAFGQRVALVLITVAFIASIKFAGVTLALLLAMPASLHVLGVRRWTVILAISASVAAAVYVLFIAVLGAAFPHGPIEHLLAPLLK